MRQMHFSNKWLGCCFAALFAFLGSNIYAQSEQQINSSYRDLAVNYVRQDLANKQEAMAKEAEQVLVNLPNNEKLYDETFLDVKAEMVQDKDEKGNDELNLVYDLSYNCRNIEGSSDDYKEGLYLWNNSNSCRAICTLTQRFLDNQCKEYFKQGKLVTIRIFSSTDAMEIKKLPYNNEYGEFKYCPATYNEEPVRITVNQKDGITTNAQLAYLRGQSVKSYLEDYVSALKNTDNKYEFITRTAGNIGGYYRRSSIQIIVHKAFDETIDAMITRLKDDDHVDANVPKGSASNPDTYVLILNNGKYSDSAFPTEKYAENDAKVFQQYCVKTLGINDRHVKLLDNPSRSKIKTDGIDWLKDVCVAQRGNVKILIYYAGLGITDPDYNPYLVPDSMDVHKIRNFDIKVGSEVPLKKCDTKKFFKQALALDSICGWFNRIQNEGITIILDANFNGQTRDGQPFLEITKNSEKMRGMRIRNDVVVMQAAQFNQPAYNYDEKEHGFFTYFILKELRHNKGDINYETLFTNVSKSVSYESSLQNKLQEPAITLGGKAKDSWGTRTFK